MVDVQSRVQPHQPVQAKDRASHRQDDPGIAWHVRKQRLAGVNYLDRRIAASELLLVLTCCLT